MKKILAFLILIILGGSCAPRPQRPPKPPAPPAPGQYTEPVSAEVHWDNTARF